MLCSFEVHLDKLVCTRCNRTVPNYGSVPKARCRASLEVPQTTTPRTTLVKPPILSTRFYSYCSAIARWVRAGMPTRTQEQIEQVHQICLDCEYLLHKHTDKQKCGKCGCNISLEMSKRNKLYLATESCPLDPPKWTALTTSI